MATVADLLSWGNWQRAQATSKSPISKPKPLPRPTGRRKPQPVTAAQLRDWRRRHPEQEEVT